jgi:hypothetical protein
LGRRSGHRASSREAGLGHLEQHGADPPALADQRTRHVHVAEGQILAEHSVRHLLVELGLPPVDVLASVGVHRLVHPAVDAAVGLLVALYVHAPNGNGTVHRELPDSRLDDGVPATHLTNVGDVD